VDAPRIEPVRAPRRNPLRDATLTDISLESQTKENPDRFHPVERSSGPECAGGLSDEPLRPPPHAERQGRRVHLGSWLCILLAPSRRRRDLSSPGVPTSEAKATGARFTGAQPSLSLGYAANQHATFEAEYSRFIAGPGLEAELGGDVAFFSTSTTFAFQRALPWMSRPPRGGSRALRPRTAPTPKRPARCR
jgi:hypothetical protein